MAAEVQLLPDMPVLKAKLTGNVDLETAETLFTKSAELMGDSGEKFFRITDVRDAESTFADMLKVIKQASQGQPGSTTDPRIQTVFVGSNTWVRLYRDAMRQTRFGGEQLPAFESMGDAMKYVQIQLTGKA